MCSAAPLRQRDRTIAAVATEISGSGHAEHMRQPPVPGCNAHRPRQNNTRLRSMRLQIGPAPTVGEPSVTRDLFEASEIPTIPARDSNLKAATIPIEGGQHWPVGTFMGSQRW